VNTIYLTQGKCLVDAKNKKMVETNKNKDTPKEHINPLFFSQYSKL
jgi:hypothetical protein